MEQLELPLNYQPVYQKAIPDHYRLPLVWKAVFILLVIYTVISSAVIYNKIKETSAQTAQIQAAPIIRESVTTPAVAGTGQVTMTATVPGWYEIERLDNANLLLKTNMQVWVNGREFIRCDDCEQDTLGSSLLDF
jgi:hypothetical protein